ncbi:3073_t:CDS:2 [Rhizophagus irregularis]|nr:3073_t:CDS:2 [Rhizophagus irregularis]
MFAFKLVNVGVAKRTFSSSATVANGVKVAVLGAAGGIGQPLSLLLKHNKSISHLSLYDIVNTPGVAADISHINTASKVTGYVRENDGLKLALTDSDVIVIPAGVPRKPELAVAAAEFAPKAIMTVISNPVNSTVPIISEVYKKYNIYDPRRILGITTLDVVRASRFVSELKGTDPSNEKVTVVGGHSGVTIIPLLSQTGHTFTDEELKTLTHRIQFGGDEVVKAKAGTGSATLSMAYAASCFVDSLLRAMVKGEKGIIEPSYVKSNLFNSDNIEYFASNVELSAEGVGKVHPLGKLSAYEKDLLAAALPELKKNIAKGAEFVANSKD